MYTLYLLSGSSPSSCDGGGAWEACTDAALIQCIYERSVNAEIVVEEEEETFRYRSIASLVVISVGFNENLCTGIRGPGWCEFLFYWDGSLFVLDCSRKMFPIRSTIEMEYETRHTL